METFLGKSHLPVTSVLIPLHVMNWHSTNQKFQVSLILTLWSGGGRDNICIRACQMEFFFLLGQVFPQKNYSVQLVMSSHQSVTPWLQLMLTLNYLYFLCNQVSITGMLEFCTYVVLRFRRMVETVVKEVKLSKKCHRRADKGVCTSVYYVWKSLWVCAQLDSHPFSGKRGFWMWGINRVTGRD